MNTPHPVQMRSHWLVLFVCLLSFVVTPRLISAAELNFTLPPETATFKPAPGYELPSALCVICHSADYVATQPRLPRSFWITEVQKMQKVYGAPILDNQIEPLVNYLVKNYGFEAAAK